jgi:hypothetical protein
MLARDMNWFPFVVDELCVTLVATEIDLTDKALSDKAPGTARRSPDAAEVTRA